MPHRIMYFMYHHSQHCSVTAVPFAPSKSIESFTLFPLLPPELRLKIWQAVAEEPQTVELSCTPTSSHLPMGRWFSHSKPSVLFSICSQSRAIALTEYTLLKFSSDQLGAPWHELYINWERDTLWLCSDLSSIWAKDLLEKNVQLQTNLRNLAIPEILWASFNQSLGSMTSMGKVWGGSGMNSLLLDVKGNLRALENVQFHS